MKITLPRFDNAQVLIIGDVMLDRYWYGATSRISPEAPVPVVKVGKQEDRPGGAANVALNVAALGAGATLVGIVGNDEAAETLRARLQAAGIGCDFDVATSKPTLTKLRVISRNQQLIRMDFEEGFSGDESIHCLNQAQHYLATTNASKLGAIVLSDYGKGTLAEIQSFIDAARSHAIPLFIDPKGADFSRYRGATLLTPNLSEFEAVVGKCANEEELVSKGKALIDELNLDVLLITRGENGMTLLRADKLKSSASELHLPARAREVFDVTGAGDTVIAVLAAALAANEPYDNAVALANLAAGIVVGKLGTATVSGPELRRALQVEHGLERGVVSSDQLSMALEDARERGEKIVFTNGCFDIIHAGHVGYLEEAKKLGDRLVVAINDDASVTRLKGAGRPINPVDRRMAVLAGLEAVDWVVSFAEDTPENLLTLIKPDVLVKGGDYSDEQVVGASIVKAYGGVVRALSLYDNCSTTAMIEKMKIEDNKDV